MTGKREAGKGKGEADLQSRLQTAVGDAYRIGQELGGGGMSHVFLAREVRLGRKVVIKVLPPEMAAGVSVERFEREIQLAARLQHPHIVPLLTAGSSEDLLYYVMPYIEGESLRARLAREGELPVPEALRILRDVIDALGYAHGQQLVHRDIKPDNVLLSGKHALVTDFGVAKAVANSADRHTLTSMGVALGTPLYMAPEQATADPNVDHRADIYALGALAYEMLCGRPPFTGGTAQAVMAAHLADAPEPVTKHRTAVPEALNALILRCLEKKPADRWQSAEELLPQLEAMLTPTGLRPADAGPPISSGTVAALKRTHPARVAGLFALVTAALLAGAYGAVRAIGLPDWVFWGAVGLLAAGLPLVLLTGRQERARALTRASGRLDATPASGLARHLTWRTAFLSGVLAFAGLAVVSAAFMALRAEGVGPFATLVSSGVLKERDLLILADFANRTSDSTLGASITEALRIDLTRSPVVRLVEGNEVAATLRRMQRDPATPLSEAVAREVAQREGAAAVVTGEVAPLGSGYVLAARVVSATDSTTLLAERETAADAAGLIPAVDRLSSTLREHIGESLRTIRAGQPLEQVTTSSLAALRAYSEGVRLYSTGSGATAALPLLNEAVALDSSFGMAWRAIGILLNNAQVDHTRMLEAVQHAYALRGRMPPHEAAHATAQYDALVLGDHQKAAQVYERMVATWPDDATALTDLCVYLVLQGHPAEAEGPVRRAVALEPEITPAQMNLVNVLAVEGKAAAADSALAAWARRAPDLAQRLFLAADLAAARGRYPLAMRYADSAASRGKLDAIPIGYPVRASVAAEVLRVRGRVREAELADARALDRMPRSGPVAGRYVPALATGVGVAEAFLVGRPDSAVRLVEAGLRRRPLDSIPPADRPYGALIYFYASAGRLERAAALAAEYRRLVPAAVRATDGAGHMGLARLALGRGDGRAALAGFRRAAALLPCLTCTAFDEAQAFERVGEPDSAIAAYGRYVNQRPILIETRDIYLGPALRRLGELYAAKGERAKALEYYGRLADLWKNADPELQPIVRDVKQRMARLAGEKR